MFDIDLSSFSFLTDRHIILAVPSRAADRHRTSTLIIVDFLAVQNVATRISDLDFEVALDFPTMSPAARALDISVRSDPSPSWTPHPDLKVPFHTGRRDRIFVVTLKATTGTMASRFLLLVPSSTILSKLDSTPRDERGCHIHWDDWGPDGTQLLPAPAHHSFVWVCYVFGMSFIAPGKDLETVEIYDFNQLPIKRFVAKGVQEESPVTTIVTEPSLVISEHFQDPIKTRLPYRKRVKQLPHNFRSVMLSEDAIVTVDDVSLQRSTAHASRSLFRHH